MLVEAPGEVVFYFETKTTVASNPSISDMWNFLVRDSKFGADMSVFLIDANFNLDATVRAFEILYAFAEQLTRNNVPIKPDQINLDGWLQGDPNSIITFHRKIEKSIYYLYFPILIINGGDKIKKNIGKALSLYYTGIQHVSPFSRLSRERTGSVFQKLPNWGSLPKESRKETVRKRIMSIVGW